VQPLNNQNVRYEYFDKMQPDPMLAVKSYTRNNVHRARIFVNLFRANNSRGRSVRFDNLPRCKNLHPRQKRGTSARACDVSSRSSATFSSREPYFDSQKQFCRSRHGDLFIHPLLPSLSSRQRVMRGFISSSQLRAASRAQPWKLAMKSPSW
jgi:hypothetical protein